MFSTNCCFLTFTQISQEADQMVWYSHFLKNFPQFVVIHTVKGIGVVSKAEVDVFLELSCFFDDPTDVGTLISGASAFSKSSLNIWKFMVYVLLKPGLENFEHYFASVWDECNCAVVWAFFGIAFLWDSSWGLEYKRSQDIPGVTGKFGLGVQKEAGQKLTVFCQENVLAIASTLFQQKRPLYTWTLSNSQYQNQIDYILCSQRWSWSCIQCAKRRPGADCGSDDQLLIAKFRLKLKKAGKTTRPARNDLNLLWIYSRGDEYIQRIRSSKRSTWRTMDRGLKYCTGSSKQNHPKEKKCKKAKWLSEEDLV